VTAGATLNMNGPTLAGDITNGITHCDGCAGVAITGNNTHLLNGRVTGWNFGVQVSGVSYVQINRLTVDHNIDGIFLFRTTNTTVADNVIRNNQGIAVTYDDVGGDFNDGHTLTGNTITDNFESSYRVGASFSGGVLPKKLVGGCNQFIKCPFSVLNNVIFRNAFGIILLAILACDHSR
jgi:parallel beta-helix repeat protein